MDKSKINKDINSYTDKLETIYAILEKTQIILG